MLTGRGRNLTMVVLAAGVAATVGGCGGGAARPAGLPSIHVPTAPAAHESSVAAPGPDATPVAPHAAALAVVRRYYLAFNRLHRTMDARPVAALFTAGCACQVQVRSIRRAAARGERYVDRASVNVMRPSIQDAHHAYVLVNLDTTAGGLVTTDGHRLTSAAPQHGVQRVFRLVRRHGRWLIAAIEAA